MYGAMAPLAGALVTLMSGINSRLSLIAGAQIAVVVIHSAGLMGILLISAIKRDRALPGKVHWTYYMGGVIGVGTVFASNYAFSILGASLTVAAALLGQTTFSIAADAVGLLGRIRHPLSLRRMPGITLAFAGVLFMSGDWRMATPALVAFAAGVCSGLSAVVNGELGVRKGVLYSSRANYLTGLVTALLILLGSALGSAVFRGQNLSFQGIREAGPFLALSGGLMGAIVVSIFNIIIPRIPVFSATVLIFSGQTAAGLAYDAVMGSSLDGRKIIGTAALLAGLALDALLSGGKRDREKA